MHRQGQGRRTYEFGVKASIVTNNRRAPGGLFVLHARSLPDNPYDGHTLRDVIDRTETLTGCAIERAYVDKGYRGHDAQNPRRVRHRKPHRARQILQRKPQAAHAAGGQKRGVFGAIKRELRRRSAVEPIIGHLKAEGSRRSERPDYAERNGAALHAIDGASVTTACPYQIRSA
ncbi:hypothetical protein ABIA06_005389 [Bradyrhizobium yuanmingense]